ncbi:helix-turn-helix transcriptional regulator [Gordonia polyisoprenivorans]|uniref:helix-turn-helix transcriptional regulator n=1 Tax=Gordonia polyisoprenivorans TaxID=84595 RepID=UPI001AD6B866|nr:WYL domain-containing protein [Gordonia polyisoprenivorans]QTI67164.1 WYL domain-containing protein [Gordonia polyisoprenivorans]
MASSKVSKVERLLNLVICLLATKQFVTAEYIRRNVVGYHDDGQSAEAFNRMFERDKTELRELGIPLVTGPSAMGQGLDGYRINRDSYELPDISFDRDEAAAIAMAATLWDTPEISAISQTAVLKLRAAGFDVRADDEIGVSAGDSARSMGSEATLGALLPAIEAQRAVTFTYRAGSGSAGMPRTLEPWGVVTHRGRWYVVGHDRDRADTRTFRLSRLTDVTAVDEPGSVTVPDGTDLQAIVASAVESAAGSDGRTARVWVADGRAAGLRRHAAGRTAQEYDGEPGDVLDIEIGSLTGLARMVLGAGADAVVLSPPELRQIVIDGLDTLMQVGA